MSRRRGARRNKRNEGLKAARNIVFVVLAIASLTFLYFRTVLSHQTLDEETLCPAKPRSTTVLLIDLTDPMNLPQRQDFSNQLEQLVDQIPRYGKLVIAKVDPISDRLLLPVITKCNPGTASDVSELDGNPKALERQHQEGFILPLRAAFDQLMEASSADRSPILESIQSINLTELQSGSDKNYPRRLIVASDLLQNTADISFYRKLPSADDLIGGQSFSRVRTDLRGVDVELWMFQRSDSSRTQPRALPELWERLVNAQGGRLIRVYTVSG